MKIVVLDRKTLGDDIDLSPLYALGQVECYPNSEPQEIGPRCMDADVAVVNKMRMDSETLKGVTKLKLICVAATGYDNISLDYCREKGVALCNVPGYSTESVAQISLAMVLSLVNHLPQYRELVHSGRYTADGIANRLTPVYRELSALTWGVVGGGGIGGRVAKLAESLGCRVLMHRRQADPHFETVDIDTLCKESDIISLHVPLNEGTRNLINRERIAIMKPAAVLVNTARGAVTDEAALADAILENRLGGLGVDVYSMEPFPADHPFNKILDRPNVCLTPHMAWGAIESRNRCIREIAGNITGFFSNSTKNRIV